MTTRMNFNNLAGVQVEMYEVGNDSKPLETFTSISKAARKINYKSLDTIVYQRKSIDIVWKGKTIKVYFKEV